jgi:hypothetical protein
MKRAVILLLLLLSLAACNRAGGITSADASPYQLLNSSADLSVGTSRLVLTLWDGPERLKDAQALAVSIHRLDEAGESAGQIWEGEATSYSLDGTQYWVVYPEFPEANYYGVRAVVTTADGNRVENVALLDVKDAPDAPAIGAEVPRSQTRTLDDAPIEQLTSAPPYVERFYEMSVAEAAQSGKPSIIVFATPGHCTTSLCSPVMDTVTTVSEEVGDSANVVHVEIWRDFSADEVEPAISEWGLPSEPWVFVLDEQGKVAARLDGLVGLDELRRAVREVLGG